MYKLKNINDENSGSRLLNTIINNFPFGLHAPGYNFPAQELN